MRKFTGMVFVYWVLGWMTGIIHFLLQNYDILYNLVYAAFPFVHMDESVLRIVDALYLAIVTYTLWRLLRE